MQIPSSLNPFSLCIIYVTTLVRYTRIPPGLNQIGFMFDGITPNIRALTVLGTCVKAPFLSNWSEVGLKIPST